MYFNQVPSSPDYSFASSKVRGTNQSQTSSPPWSEHSFQSTSPPRNPPAAPHIRPVPLPSAEPSTPERSYGLPTPPTSPQGPTFTLHHLLTYDRSGRIRCDVSLDVSNVQLRPGMALTTLNEYASNPSATRMTINIPGSTWGFEVTNPRGITVGDVLAKLCETMNYIVSNTEYQGFPQTTRDMAYALARRRGDQGGFKSGIRRVDFMSGNRFFVGLSKSRHGFTWDANFASLA